MGRTVLYLLFALAFFAAPAAAHEMRPGYLELKETGDETYDVLWKVPAAGEGLRLGIYVRFPAETEETSEHRGLFRGGAFVERWSVRHSGGLTGQTIEIDGLRSTFTDVLVRIERRDIDARKLCQGVLLPTTRGIHQRLKLVGVGHVAPVSLQPPRLFGRLGELAQRGVGVAQAPM